MKKNTFSKGFRPFEELKTMLEKASVYHRPSFREEKIGQRDEGLSKKRQPEIDHEEDTEIFLRAMEGVTPISKDKHVGCLNSIDRYCDDGSESDPDILAKLNQLVNNGEGFRVSATPEYHQGAGYNVHPEMMKRLHQGEFSIQDYIDLHGYSILSAEEALDRFLKESITAGKRAVLIVHGRGLSSKDEPVLKNQVIEKLSVGKWRKWVVAYTSAERYDGGTGATYVLLRKHPVPRRIRKNTKFCSL